MSDFFRAAFSMNWPKRLMLASEVVFLGFCVPALTTAPLKTTQWSSGLIELNQGWLQHDGDEAEWDRPEFDDSA
jgi:hypothetical protein